MITINNDFFNPRRRYEPGKYIQRSQIGDAEEWLNSRKKQLLTVLSLPATGKTWFLRCFFYLLQNKYGASVKPLWVQVDDLISQENEEADLNYSNEPLTQLTDASKKAWFSQFYEQLKEQCSALPPRWDGSTSNVSDALEQLIEQLHRYCFSGRQIVLFIDNSAILTLDSWREFEQTILDPIARKKELRLVVALREDRQIRSYNLRRQQQHLFLGDFSEEQHRGMEQIEKLSQEFTAVAPQVAQLLDQVPAYNKTHPGINTFLFLYAEKHGNIDISLTFLQHMLKALNPYHSCEIDELISLLSDIADYKNEWVIEEFAKWLKVSNTVALAQSQKLIDNHLVINIAYNRFKVVDGVRQFVRVFLASTAIEQAKQQKTNRLNLYYKDLKEIPLEIFQLKNLQELNLGGNYLESIPSQIGQLQNLTKLSLHDNNLSELPATIQQLAHLEELDLQGNPLLSIPAELLGKIKEPKAILQAYFAQQTQPLRQIKLMILGEGDVGKTSLVQRLQDQPLIDEGPTQGVSIDKWKIGKNKDQIDINIWDFGGQEIYHAPHQFFLSHRTLYCLLINARQDDAANRLDYWLNLIANWGGDSPIILVVNKIDQGTATQPERQLKLQYPQLQEIVYVSAKENRGINKLKKKIKKVIKHMPHLQDQIPVSWFAVKDRLISLKNDYISYQKFTEICQEETITDRKIQDGLAKLLHNLGVILCFVDDLDLVDTSILQPEWVTTAIYKIMGDRQLQGNGVLRPLDLERILDSNRYPREKYNVILKIMAKFELAFRMPDTDDWLIPTLLAPDIPEKLDWKERDTPVLQIKYEQFYPSILARLMVRLGPYTQTGQRWRDGFIVDFEHIRAKVQVIRRDHRIDIWLDGLTDRSRSSLDQIRKELKLIHGTFCKLKSEELVPIPGYPPYTIPYKDLITFRDKMRIRQAPYAPIADYIDVDGLLNGIDYTIPTIAVIRSALNKYYNIRELERLICDLKLSKDDFSYETQDELIIELISWFKRRNTLEELVNLIRKQRQSISFYDD